MGTKKFELSNKRSAVSICIAAALGLGYAGNLQAQETEEKLADVEVINITGSRIPTDPNVLSSVPVQSLDSKDISMSGELNLADIVADIPALISSTTAENTTTGANALNLRGLGTERTLTLVNGRRHVAGFRGSSAVDVGTIPRALVERVEVTTGGASAVYGADAVTGVVNFILKDDFEGVEINATGALPQDSGGDSFAVDGAFGQNFDDDKGNIVLTLSYETEQELLQGDRDWSRNNGLSTVVPTAPGESTRMLASDVRYWLTSNEGSIAPTFGGRDVLYVDINGNGIPDCQESEGGRTGYLAGCWITNPDGSVRVNSDGPLYSTLLSSGGDGAKFNFDNDTLMPNTDKFIVNLNGNYQITDELNVFFEAKYVRADTEYYSEYDSYYDTLFILPDNPYIPEQLLPVVDQTGGLLITQDAIAWDDDYTNYVRETKRFVGGFTWDYAYDHSLEFAINHGSFSNETTYSEQYIDRIFAAMDATTDANGNTVCRSDLDPTAAYEIDYFAFNENYANGNFYSDRYYTFTPGDGQCAPLNPFGLDALSDEAKDFITARMQDKLEIEQTVVSLTAVGQFEFLEGFLDGPLGYAAGVEYREESSDNYLDPLALGILPEGTSYTPGVLVSEVSPWLNFLTGIDNAQQFNTGGEYDVTDTFLEVRLPIFMDREFAYEFTLDGAVRLAKYSTLGTTTTWKVGFNYSPIEEINFRGTLSEAVRAPNISELFDPQLPQTYNLSIDSCDQTNVFSGSENRVDNCIANLQGAGVPLEDIVDESGNYIWINPLTARFSGTTGGNPKLDVETAKTVTLGAVYRSSFIEGLIVSVDYWSVEIEDAISGVSGTNVLNGCLDSASYPDVPFCGEFERRADGGLSDLSTIETNFAKTEAEGFDVSVNYTFNVAENDFGISLVGTRQKTLDRYYNPNDPTDVDVVLEEIRVPKTAGSLELSWSRDAISVALQTTYQSRQAYREVEESLGINGYSKLFADGGFYGTTVIHDINANYEIDETLSVFGGINNIADESPFATETAWPVGPRGRTFFVGVNYSM
ncbi:TonB-dependent receptor domain-containing protein [Alteromonas lipolytica]|uniref:Outer membrane cobalamin receptor protein n=1 Tax=Alteromonas lipolytica TaxID=1856405 RepID=A0A1E8FAG3_9ALTE|nr:TonB-dependent receptor [Alteromonas lipolytica]OFI32914.1 outer membrane cobalamin receptor protein [Alteromonas lipolytica]GGF64256.1 TonB-dependent receptor [Alteromonas lipolytica]